MTDPIPAWKRLANHLSHIERQRNMTQSPKTSSTTAEKTERNSPRLSPEAALAKTAFEASASQDTRDLLKRGKTVVVVIRVPSASWVSPMSTFLASQVTEAKRIARDGNQKSRDVPSDGNDQVLTALAEGRSVIGISQSPERHLPSALVGAADFTIIVKQPDGAALTRAIALSVGGRAQKKPPKDLGAGLDFVELAAAIRPGSKPAEAVRRLQAAGEGRSAHNAAKVAMPTLEEAVFYGEARDWGLALAVDVAEAKISGDWSGVDRGACFFGPPGTGKTFLARMIAAACKMPLIETSVAELFASSAGYLDSVIKAQRAIFAKATAAAPSVIFWDEIEAMPSRSKMSSRGRDWWLPVVDDFMLCVSNAPPNVIMLGCTNHLDLVEESLLRPGRMERAIEVKPATTAEGLAMLLRFHLGGDLSDCDLMPLARMRIGATAAEAMEMVRRARRVARTAKRAMEIRDLVGVLAPPDDRPRHVLLATARHEAAHAVVTLSLGVEELKSVSIIGGENGAAGSMRVRIGKSLELRGRAHFEDVVVGTLAGRAAEILINGQATAGAGGHPNSDLAVCTRIITALHASLGLGAELVYRGEPASETLGSSMLYDPVLRGAVEADLQRLHKRAEDLVLAHRTEIEAVAEALLRKQHLEADEVKSIMENARAGETATIVLGTKP